MEQCPKCKNWTLFYNPQSEEKICYCCDFKLQIKYDVYLKLENIADSLRYPSTIPKILTLKP